MRIPLKIGSECLALFVTGFPAFTASPLPQATVELSVQSGLKMQEISRNEMNGKGNIYLAVTVGMIGKTTVMFFSLKSIVHARPRLIPWQSLLRFKDLFYSVHIYFPRHRRSIEEITISHNYWRLNFAGNA